MTNENDDIGMRKAQDEPIEHTQSDAKQATAQSADGQQPTEDERVQAAFQHLLDTYLASPHRKKIDIINKAFNFAKQAHKGVRRLSGEPYIMHPIAVAQIACEEIGLGSTSICAALLHDVVEDTDYTIEDIENMFGAKIAQIVDGLTKISGGIFGEHASAQAENFKKLLLTMSEDIRVILIKMCDRLHNMRTLDSQPANKQYKIAGETLYIYAPLANRLGLNKIKTELEDLSFRYEHPQEYDRIKKKLSFTQQERDQLFSDFTAPIREALDKMQLKYEIKARVKSPYSIWQKMQAKHVTFEEIYDILAVRIIFTPKQRDDEINECFNIYVAISKIYKSHPDRLRDWLNHPKANGYQALHVTLMSHQGQWIEVQIRSDRMNEIAEKGFAAHWKYKETEITEDEGELGEWLSTIKEILDDPQPDAMDFLDAIKLNLFASEIFVFTPKGEIKTMPTGSTALDFAFQIHTFLGSHCIGAKVNHKLVPLSHKLKSGDQVEILTSKSQHVQPDWVNFATTAKAKAKIQAILRRDAREKQKQGESELSQWLQDHELQPTSAILDKLCNICNQQKPDELFRAIGSQAVKLDDTLYSQLTTQSSSKSGGWKRYVPFLKHNSNKKNDKAQKETVEKAKTVEPTQPKTKKNVVYAVSESTIHQYKFPNCCHPIPGDDILGFIDNQQNIEIHRRDCPVANKLKASYGNRILDARWNMHRQMLFTAKIAIKAIDRPGMLLDIANVISGQMNVSMQQITIKANDGICEGVLEMHVYDRSDCEKIIHQLKQVKDMQEVSEPI